MCEAGYRGTEKRVPTETSHERGATVPCSPCRMSRQTVSFLATRLGGVTDQTSDEGGSRRSTLSKRCAGGFKPELGGSSRDESS